MAAKLSVVFYILLCLEVGVVLTVLPWWAPFGLVGDWGDNFFLLYAAQKTGLYGLQQAVASGWVRGAVSGLGILNLCMAAWEVAHFKQTVRALEGTPNAQLPSPPEQHGAQPSNSSHLPYNGRSDDREQQPGR